MKLLVNNTIAKLLRAAGLVIAICQVLAFVLSFVLIISPPLRALVPRNVQLPLSDPQDVAVGDDGRIYVFVGMYQRVQVYGRDGSFHYGFFIGSLHGGAAQLDSEDDKLTAVTARDRLRTVYNAQTGVRIAEEPVTSDVYSQLAEIVPRDPEGRTYSIVGQLWNPRVTRVDSRGDASIVVDNPFWLWPFCITPITWLMALVMLALVNRKSLLSKWNTCGRVAHNEKNASKP